MKTDANKNITNIQYNFLNLPTQVTINGRNITYIYDAAGTKLRKTVNGVTTDYAAGFIYENNVLQFFNQPEGYVEPSGSNFNYVYQYKDHLGNIRLSYKDNSLTSTPSLQIVEENNYYPFGLKHKGYNTAINGTHHKYKFNGKEYQDELGLNMYSMDVRLYDPAIGRWSVMDPVIHEKLSPYNAFDNNPVFLADPSGADAVYNWDDGKYYDGGKEVSFNQAMASHGLNADGSEKKEGDTPPDDITVNSSGMVTNVVKNGKPNKFFDESGKQLYFNDKKNDFSLIDSWEIGDRLFFPISSDELAKAVAEAGLDPLMLRVQGKLGEAWLMAAWMSRGSADFTFSYLIPNYFTQGEKSYLEEGTLRASYNSSMHFFRFGNSMSIYNLYDAGNFMWGNWMGMNGFNYSSSKFGSQANELGKDSPEDQRAIKNGYNFYKF